MKIKEDIRFRVSPDVEQHLFMIKSKSVFEFRGRHEVLDADGAVIGMLEKDFGKSLLRSHWHVRDAPESCSRRTSRAGSSRSCAGSPTSARTVLAADLAAVQLRAPPRRPSEVGTYKRVLGKFRDRYVLELEPAPGVDHRLLVAFAIGLDALQDR